MLWSEYGALNNTFRQLIVNDKNIILKQKGRKLNFGNFISGISSTEFQDFIGIHLTDEHIYFKNQD